LLPEITLNLNWLCLLSCYIMLSDTGSISTQNKIYKNIQGDTHYEIAPEYLWLVFTSVLSCEAPQTYRYLARGFSCALEMAAPAAPGIWTLSAGVACAWGWQQTRILLHPNNKSTNMSTYLLGNESQSTSGCRMFCNLLYMIMILQNLTLYTLINV
jgi:hypothetical protein